MPGGQITYFSGDIHNAPGGESKGEAPFGFFRVKTTAPESLHKPILPRRIQTEHGVRTVFALGT